MEKLKMHSPDLSQDNVAKIREIFPDCVTEAADEKGEVRLVVDFDQLRQQLSDRIVEGPQERYRLDWPGKREALLTANAPIAKTLRPCREESVNFDVTGNLFVEGDNLDALKLLQEGYLGKVKMIYIDPPYNTGNDFIYDDDFAQSSAEFLELSGQKGESGERLVANTESNGRFHSDWLSMIYSRLKIARNFLSEDGVIFMSIDENEVDNLSKIADEIFGEDNRLFKITLLCNPKGRSQDKFVANCHEYILGYSRSSLPKGAINVPKSEEEVAGNYTLADARGPYRELELRNTHREFGKHNRPSLYYPFFVSSDGKVSLNPSPNTAKVLPNWDDGFEGCWTWGLEKATRQIDELVGKNVKGSWKVYRKNYAQDEDGEATKQVKSIWIDKRFHTEKGQSVFNELFGTREKLFQSPKSVDTIKELILMGGSKDGIVLDFFAGSASTAHAVLSLNASDGGNRRFVLVQLPEEASIGSEALKAGYQTISEISKERVRRAGKMILEVEGHHEWRRDIGFRVLKIDSSNMSDVFYRPDEVRQADLYGQVQSVRLDRTGEDLLFQVLIDWGLELTLPIAQEELDGKTIYCVDSNALIACFDVGVSEAIIKEIAARGPLRAVFRDTSFDSDADRINAEQIFRQLSPSTELKAI